MTTKKNAAATTTAITATHQTATIEGFAPQRKQWTSGAILVTIEGWKDPETERTVAKVSSNGNKYWTLYFDDGTEFTLMDKARRALLYPTTVDGEPNPCFLEKGIKVGMKFEANHIIQEDDSVLTVLRYVK